METEKEKGKKKQKLEGQLAAWCNHFAKYFNS